MNPGFLIGLVVVLLAVFILIPAIVGLFLRDVTAGTIRIVTLWGGATRIYRGPGKSYEIPLLTNGSSLSSKAINVDLDITDQTADIDAQARPGKRVLEDALAHVPGQEQRIGAGRRQRGEEAQLGRRKILRLVENEMIERLAGSDCDRIRQPCEDLGPGLVALGDERGADGFEDRPEPFALVGAEAALSPHTGHGRIGV